MFNLTFPEVLVALEKNPKAKFEGSNFVTGYHLTADDFGFLTLVDSKGNHSDFVINVHRINQAEYKQID